ncbi:MAG TPA: Ig-like domain-containing protein, partial [Polyangiales bacterium]
MSFRSILWLGLLACTAACDSALSDAAYTAANLPPGPTLTARLEIEGDAEVEMVVRHELRLRVRYLDMSGAPLASQPVEFGLSGSAEGASLDKASVRTNADGVAETKLTAGSAVSTFQVRASAADASPLYFDVRVLQAARPTLTLNVVYEGQRKLESRRFSVVGDMDCDKLLNHSTDAVRVAYVLPAAEQEIPYQESLVAGGHYAAFAWGSDDTNSTLATGCANFVAPTEASAEDAALTLTVKLEDLAFSLAPSYDVTLGLDLSVPLAALAARTREAVLELLPETKTPEASYLLDLLGSNVDPSARASLGLDATLAGLLAQSGTGPLAYFQTLSASVREEGSSSSLEGQLAPGTDSAPARFTLTRMVSMRGGKSARELDLGALV